MDYYDWKHRESSGTLRMCWYMFIGIVVLLFLGALFSGCQTIRYVPVEKVRTDTLYQKVVQRDSIHVHDSVTIREKGDTVMIEHWRTQWRDRLLRDTVYRSRVDSVQVPYPVEKKLTRWQSFCIDYGKLTLGASVMLVVFIIIWLVRSFGKRS